MSAHTIHAFALPSGYHVDGASITSLTSQQDRAQLKSWDAYPTDKVLVWLANPYAHNLDFSAKKIASILRTVITQSANAQLVRPNPRTDIPNARPVVFLVRNLSGPDYVRLVQADCWSTSDDRNAAIFTFGWFSSPSSFCHTIVALVPNDTPQRRMLIKNAVRDCLLRHPAVSTFIRLFHDNMPPDFDDDQSYLLDSISVSSFHNSASNSTDRVTLWNIHIAPPTRCPPLHAIWRLLLAAVLQTIPGLGSCALADHAFICGLCLGSSHPTQRCHIPHAPLWFGPTALDVEPVEQAFSSPLAQIIPNAGRPTPLPQDDDVFCYDGSSLVFVLEPTEQASTPH